MLLDNDAVERSTYFLDITVRDERGDALVPASLVWTLTDGDGVVVNSRQRVAIENPGSTETVTLSGADLQMFTRQPREMRIVTIEATYAAGKTIKDEIQFYVRGLKAI